MKKALVVILLLVAAVACAQTVPAPTAEPTINTIYAAGVTANPGATPQVAGTALFAKRISDTHTFSFTAVDFVPATYKPFTVTSNVSTGIAQEVAKIGKFPIYVTGSAGISFSGNNTGFAATAGAATLVHIKGSFGVMPTFRAVRSNVSNGSGWQILPSVLFAWGQ